MRSAGSIALPADYPDDPAIAVLSDAAFRLLIRSTCYARRFSTDGTVPAKVMLEYARGKVDVIDELMRGHHLTRQPRYDRYYVVGYLEVGQSSEAIARKRAESAIRMKKKRAKDRGSTEFTSAGSDEVGVNTGEAQPQAPATSSEAAPPTPADKTPYEPPAIVYRLAHVLADCITANGAARPRPGKQNWYDPIRLLIDKDGYTAADIEKAIRWASDDEFWRSNILSGITLRRHMGRLTLKMRQGPPSRPDPAAATMQAAMELEAEGR